MSMDLNEELRKRHGITKLSNLHHAELTPSMLPTGISHYRGWIYDPNRYTLDQVRAFVYNASLSCVSAAKYTSYPFCWRNAHRRPICRLRITEECTRRNYAASTTYASIGNRS